MPKIRLEKYKWTSNGIISVIGFAWLNGEYLSEKTFLKLLLPYSDSFESIQKLVVQLNGQFSIVIKNEQEIFAACSHTWSYPLFYRKNQGEYSISDDPKDLSIADDNLTQDIFAQLYFLNFGVTPLSSTLLNEVFQIQPGELVCLSETGCKSFSFGLCAEGERTSGIHIVEEDKLYDFFLVAFEKYFDVLKKRQVLLPLTRGYDSRLLACMLKEFGHENVVCVTWGRAENSEVATARRVAEKLGYRHVFMNYSQGIAKNFTLSPDFFEYTNYAGHWSSMPFLYEYFGLKELKQKEIVDNDVVALPGHPGDFLRGEHLREEMENASPGQLATQITSIFGSSHSLRKSEQKEIRAFIENEFFSEKKGKFWQTYERWDYHERQCKFIGNSSQVFSYFETDYMMPLFDLDLLRFFSEVPFDQKVRRNLYNDTLEKFFFKKLGVDFDLKIGDPPKRALSIDLLKSILIRIAPEKIKSWYYQMNDDIYYKEITEELKSYNNAFFYKKPLRPNAYNAYIIQWYLQFVNNSLQG